MWTNQPTMVLILGIYPKCEIMEGDIRGVRVYSVGETLLGWFIIKIEFNI